MRGRAKEIGLPLGNAVQGFLTHLRVSGAGARTLDNRTRVLGALTRFVDDGGLAALTCPMLVGFFEAYHSAGRRPCTPT